MKARQAFAYSRFYRTGVTDVRILHERPRIVNITPMLPALEMPPGLCYTDRQTETVSACPAIAGVSYVQKECL